MHTQFDRRAILRIKWSEYFLKYRISSWVWISLFTTPSLALISQNWEKYWRDFPLSSLRFSSQTYPFHWLVNSQGEWVQTTLKQIKSGPFSRALLQWSRSDFQCIPPISLSTLITLARTAHQQAWKLASWKMKMGTNFVFGFLLHSAKPIGKDM